MAVTVRVASTPADVTAFIKLQWKFYDGDPNWVPPLIFDRRKLLNTAKNPFYAHAAIRLFIAEKDGVPGGRIAAITNANHNAVHGDRVGFFGFFECIDDQSVADALFDAAAAWLREKGMDTMRGPLNPSINDELGLLVDGFDSPPVILMTYNPRYYAGLIEGHGFRKEKDLFAYLLHNHLTLTPKLERGQRVVRERSKLTVRNIDFKRLDEEIVIVKKLYNASWEKNWGAVAMTDEEFDFLAADMKSVIGDYKEFAMIAEKDGAPIGFALCLPDINQLLIRNRRGRLIPGAIRLLTGMKKIDLVRVLVLGFLPEHRGHGYDAVLYWEILTRAAKRGIMKGEASWVLEDNTMMNRAADMMNASPYKRYRIYDIAI